MQYIDLTQTITNAMPVYPGDKPPKLVVSASLESNGTANSELTTSMHVGTHLDGPAHMIPGGRSLVEFPLDTFFGSAVVLDARGQKEVSEAILSGVSLEEGSIVLVCTGWANRYQEENYYTEYPVLSEGFARTLVESGVKMVGLDGPSPDQPPFAVHKILLRSNILIIENLINLELLLQKRCSLTVLPLKVNADSAPARVVATVE